MEQEHEIVAWVYAAKEDNQAADDLIRKYLPFIKAQTAKFIGRAPQEGRDDELSVALLAFHEAMLAFERERGNFLAYAALTIRSRLIDFSRKEERHRGLISLDGERGTEDERTLLDALDSGRDEAEQGIARSAARTEILHFTQVLKTYDLSLADIADNCPKQERTLAACHLALAYARSHPELLAQLERTKKLPLRRLAAGAGVERKTLERHRRYLVAILLAYTNGFEIIRGHLRQVAPRKGGQAL